MLVNNLVTFAESLTGDLMVQDVRIGLGYTCVELTDGSTGIAWTPKSGAASCTHLNKAGSLIGLPAGEMLRWLAEGADLERALGLAVFNAINSKTERKFLKDDTISLLDLSADNHVVMVGYFGPIIPQIKKIGCRLDIVELDGRKPGIIGEMEGYEALSQCDAAIITSTSIINNTIDTLLDKLKKNKSAVMLGPSTPMCKEAFEGTRITQLSGSLVTNAKQVKDIVSQGGGTRLLKKHLAFVTEKVDFQ